MIGVRGAAKSPPTAGAEAVVAHQAGHALAAHTLPPLAELGITRGLP
jgi:hypothetical protein